MNENIRNRIITAAYGDANLFEKISVWFLIRSNPECKKLFDEYRQTAESVHSILPEEFPDASLNKIFEKTLVDENYASGSVTLFGNPVIAGLAAMLLLILAAIAFNTSREEVIPHKEYSQQEVLEAEQQVKASLAIISKILNNTADKLENDILPQKVGKPIKQGFEIIQQLFPKGGKNNENS